MKKIIYLIILLFYVVITSGYTPPDYDDIDLVLDTGYTAPSYDDIDLVLDTIAVDSCTCPGDSSAHEFDLSDECNVVSCTAGDITFTGIGYTNCSGTWSIADLGDPGADGILYIQSNCYIGIN